MIVAAIIVTLAGLALVITNFMISNVFFRESITIVNGTIYDTVTDPGELARIDNIFGGIQAQFSIILVILIVGFVSYVYIQATKTEVVTEVL